MFAWGNREAQTVAEMPKWSQNSFNNIIKVLSYYLYVDERHCLSMLYLVGWSQKAGGWRGSIRIPRKCTPSPTHLSAGSMLWRAPEDRFHVKGDLCPKSVLAEALDVRGAARAVQGEGWVTHQVPRLRDMWEGWGGLLRFGNLIFKNSVQKMSR